MAFDAVFSGLWLFGDNPVITEPLPQNWRWNSPDYTRLAFNDLDYQMVDRSADFVTLEVGDRIYLRSIATIGNWAMFDLVAVTDHTTWFELEVSVFGTGPVPGLPINRQRCLFDFLRPVAVGAVDPDAVAAILAGHLHRPVDDVAVARAVDAAIVYVVTYTGLDAEGLGLPDDPLTVEGLVNLGERIYLDPSSPGGQLGAVGDPSFVPMFSPEDLAAHNHHYWDRLIVSWGIA